VHVAPDNDVFVGGMHELGATKIVKRRRTKIRVQ